MDGSLFHLRHLQAKTKTVEKLIVETLFTDDYALLAHSESDLQVIVNSFFNATKLLGLTICTKKTEVINQPVPDVRPTPPLTVTDGDELKNVDECRYLGSTISCDGSLERDRGTY